MTDPDFWNDQTKAQDIIDKNNALKSIVNGYYQLTNAVDDMSATRELLQEEYDEDMKKELEEEVQQFEEQIDQYELQLLLDGSHDANNAILELHPGAGGTESQDWVSMLLRMYQRYCEQNGFKVETVDYLPGDEAGVKSVTLLIKGHNAYGYLKAEKGVHRLVRISPFDSSGRRHTSFASCDVIPDFNNDEIEIEINPDDITVDTFRASGAGGQHINKTDSAVRITHLPSGMVVECQDGRSQHSNKAQAMKVLAARLYNQRKNTAQAKLAADRKSLIGSGDRSERIRTYNFAQGRVTDHRINLTLYKLDSILEGQLDELINPLLLEYQAEQLEDLNDLI